MSPTAAPPRRPAPARRIPPPRGARVSTQARVATPPRPAPKPRKPTIKAGPAKTRPGKSAPRRTAAPARKRAPARSAPHAPGRGRVVAFVVVLVVFALVSAVMFHVVLAQGQLELDHLDIQISDARREYEQLRLEASQLGSPQQIIEQAQRQGLEFPADPPPYIDVPGAKVAATRPADPSTTLGEWQDVKPSLGDGRP